MAHKNGAAGGVSVVGVSPAHTTQQVPYIYAVASAIVSGAAHIAAGVCKTEKERNDMMTIEEAREEARGYLNQIEKCKKCIEHKKLLLESLSSKILNISALRYSADKVSGGGNDMDFADDIIRKIELENEINGDIIELEYKKNDVTNEIHKLNSPIYINILFKKYVELKTFNKIAREINYSFKQTCRLHKKALAAFGKDVLECPIAHDV